ncbi:MAG TPA: CHAT domain-containing protein [Candidatus Angelobacter sp.]|jgi:CHAT domain-containing protein|nr:CHAT domain-containing protein [Candidatus Angelobacter sp.]
MGDQGAAPQSAQWIAELATIADEEQRRQFLLSHRSEFSDSLVDALYAGVVESARVDIAKVSRFAEAIGWIAAATDDAYAKGQSLRAAGHVLYLTGKYRQAIAEYQAAIDSFEAQGRELEMARTISAALQSLIYDGQYDRALKLAARAQEIFQANHDELRLARLASNMANIYYRQDRFHEALHLYERAYKGFQQFGEPGDIAIVLRNIAVCCISLNEFSRAQETYLQARRFAEEHGFTLLVPMADYNIAYLHYMRGEYLKAIELYDKTRVVCEKLNDRYHQALCDLDESEIYLELNLTEGGEALARSAFHAFTDLNMRYEAAKAATFSAIAISQEGHYKDALTIFDEARELFVKEQNQLWPPLIDLYKALVLYEAGENDDAEDLALAALKYFRGSVLPAKAALCELLLAAIEIRASDPEEARRYCSSALSRLLHVESPAAYQAYFMLGQAEEASGNTELARQAYEKAYKKLEDLRSLLGKEELKIAFLKNKLDVYEGLVITSLAVHSRSCTEHDTFAYIEQAKSRSLADLIAFRSSEVSPRSVQNSPSMGQFRDLQQKLNWTYHQIELEELLPGGGSRDRIRQLREQSRSYEDAMVRVFSQIQNVDREYADMQSAASISAAQVQATIPEDAMLLEFYAARDQFYICVMDRESLRIVPVAGVAAVREKLRLLQLQLAKFRLGEDYIRPLENTLFRATRAHLEEIYQLLIAPVREHLRSKHLVIVPHTFLHYLPFHALFDGNRYLIDDFSISYAPSGSIFALCQGKPYNGSSNDTLVLAVPDARAPHIAEEGRFVAETMKPSRLFLGDEATEEQLRTHGPRSRFIHIATHGYFRQDNPMFSSIRLGQSMLSLFDLYRLQLDAELVTLSGCGTGMNVVIGGDELIGLVRGLLYAGARSLLVSLWEVHDESTAEFMRDFYRSYESNSNKSNALRDAVISLREKRPHPYYWAAFSMVGKVT